MKLEQILKLFQFRPITVNVKGTLTTLVTGITAFIMGIYVHSKYLEQKPQSDYIIQEIQGEYYYIDRNERIHGMPASEAIMEYARRIYEQRREEALEQGKEEPYLSDIVKEIFEAADTSPIIPERLKDKAEHYLSPQEIREVMQ